MLGVYSFVFVGVFRQTWPGGANGGGLEFSLQVFAGLLVFNLFAEVAGKAPAQHRRPRPLNLLRWPRRVGSVR